MKLSLFDALKVTGIGLVVVFAVLFLLILMIELIHVLLKEKTKKSNRVLNLAQVPTGEGIYADEEFLAAVSAAVSQAIDMPNGSFEIKSIKEK